MILFQVNYCVSTSDAVDVDSPQQRINGVHNGKYVRTMHASASLLTDPLCTVVKDPHLAYLSKEHAMGETG